MLYPIPRGDGKSTLTAIRNIDLMIQADTIRKEECKQFADEMAAIRKKYEHDDEEVCHIKMDELMCKTLLKLGFYEGVKIFEDTKKWYA